VPSVPPPATAPPTQNRRRALGARGERIAAEHLMAAGYRILDRNFRTRHGELDLVASNGRALVFCEVKTRVTRSPASPYGPFTSLGRGKRRQVRSIAREWLANRGGCELSSAELRFDAIGVTVSTSGEVLAVDHLEDAF
jgi:putative endonuclease